MSPSFVNSLRANPHQPGAVGDDSANRSCRHQSGPSDSRRGQTAAPGLNWGLQVIRSFLKRFLNLVSEPALLRVVFNCATGIILLCLRDFFKGHGFRQFLKASVQGDFVPDVSLSSVTIQFKGRRHEPSTAKQSHPPQSRQFTGRNRTDAGPHVAHRHFDRPARRSKLGTGDRCLRGGHRLCADG